MRNLALKDTRVHDSLWRKEDLLPWIIYFKEKYNISKRIPSYVNTGPKAGQALGIVLYFTSIFQKQIY